MWRFTSFALATLLATNLLAQSKVAFVDVEQLAAHHPAWQLAQRLMQEQKAHLVPLPFSVILPLTEAPFPSSFAGSLSDWEQQQRQQWLSEVAALKRQQQVGAWQLQLALPPLPSVDPAARWRYIVQRREQQNNERVRLRLRLAFADLLSPEERKGLEQRWRELDAALEPPPAMPSLLLLPAPTSPPSEIPAPEPLTNEHLVLRLVAPPSTPPVTAPTFKATLGEKAPALPRAFAALQNAAREAAKAFALHYGHKKGWRVVFTPQANAPDATKEVLAAWLQWLRRTASKE